MKTATAKTGTTTVATVRSPEFGDALIGLIDADIYADRLSEDDPEYKRARARSAARWRRLVNLIDRHTAREVKRITGQPVTVAR